MKIVFGVFLIFTFFLMGSVCIAQESFGDSPPFVLDTREDRPQTSFADSAPFTLNTLPNISIPLASNRFELISFNMTPPELSAATVFTSISNNLLAAYQNNGAMYLPQIPLNTIGDIDVLQGYKLFCNAPSILQVGGFPLDPQSEYSVTSGIWNWVGYPLASPVNPAEALAAIADNVVVVQNDNGMMWIPSIPLQTLFQMIPGEGYMFFVNEDLTFTYSAEAMLAKQSDVWVLPEVEDAPQATGLPYNVLVTMTDELKAVSPAVIELYDGSLLVGKGAVLGDRPLTPITAWEGAPERNLSGFTAGNPISLRVYNANGTELSIVRNEIGNFVFGAGPYATVTLDKSVMPAIFTVSNGYPNPFNPTLTVPFDLPEQGIVNFAVFNVLGQKVFAVDKSFDAGSHRFVFDSAAQDKNMTSGVYFLSVNFKGQVKLQKIVLLK